MFRNTHPASTDGKKRKNDERYRHCPVRFLRIIGRFRPWIPQEGQGYLPHRVESGQEGRNCQSDKNSYVAIEGTRQDFILRPKTCGDNRKAG